MKIGKLTISDLKSLVLQNIKNNRKEVLTNPQIGGDCAMIETKGEKIIYLSSDPITGATKNIGKLAVHINANDIATSGTSPTGIMLTIIAPPNTTKNEIEIIIKEAQAECEKLNISILGGHTEISDGVNRIIVSCTSIGIGEKNDSKILKKPKAGDKILITKGIGIEGTGIIATEKATELEKIFGKEFVEKAKKYLENISVVNDGVLANKKSVGMHDVTEGGLFGAVWEMCELYNLGAKIYEDKIFISEETQKICEYLQINPLKLISSGTMLLIVPEENLESLTKVYDEAEIKSFCIGKLTEEKEILFVTKNNQVEKILPPESDELYRVL